MADYQRELNLDLETFTVKALRATFSHVYYIWKVLKPELGYKKALQTYGSVWKAIALVQFQTALENLGITEVKDIPTLGKIVNYCFSANPCLYETVEETEDYHIGHIHWCPNPAYGPHDCTLSRHEYYRNAEVPLTIDPYIRVMVEESQKMGLNMDVEVAVPEARCRDGNASFCQIHLWKRGKPEPKEKTLKLAEKTFIEDEMNGEEPITFILNRQKKDLGVFGAGSLIGFIFTDMAAYDGMEEWLGKDKAQKLYEELWLLYAPMWAKEARLDLGIGKVTNIRDLGGVLAYCQRRKFIPFDIVSSDDNKVTLMSGSDPFAEMPTALFGKKLGDNYFEAVSLADRFFLNKVIEEVGMGEQVKLSVRKRLVRGDDKNEMTIEYLNK